MWEFLSSKSLPLKGISLFYTLIRDKSTFTKVAALKCCERDLNTSFSDLQWRQAIYYNQTASKNMNYWELSQKLLLRWYLTPVQMHKFANIDDNTCWRGCSHKGSLIHVIWECRHISPFWKRVFSFISDLTGIILKTSLPLVILVYGSPT